MLVIFSAVTKTFKLPGKYSEKAGINQLGISFDFRLIEVSAE